MHTAVALTERFNSTLREMARAAWFDGKLEWDLILPYLVLFYNSTIQEATGCSPFFLEHGREPVLPWHPTSFVPEASDSVNDFVLKHLYGLHLTWEAAMRSVHDAEEARKSRHDEKYQTNVKFNPGDRVLVLQPGRVSKMDLPYAGPYRILWGPDERDRYALRDLEGRRWNQFHVGKLKLWPVTEDLDDEYYIVDQILDSKQASNGEWLFLVKWRGYSAKYNSWEPLANLNKEAKDQAMSLIKATADDRERQGDSDAHLAEARVQGSAVAHAEQGGQHHPLAIAPPSTSKRKIHKETTKAGDSAVVALQAPTTTREERAARRAARLWA
ncbi:hypothetical protein AB1Y20_010803 [Prymnesium parvum]|uniref:Chromo domain-containing protein n=1 Tax=Prymnesium parvum TaxID=97485 RepID=A0AB34IQP8_PRYPA